MQYLSINRRGHPSRARLETVMAVRCVVVTGHEFGLAALRGLLRAADQSGGELEVPLVLTLDERHRDDTVGYSSLGVDLTSRNTEVRVASDRRLERDVSHLRRLDPNFILVVGWSRLVGPTLLDLPSVVRGSRTRHGPKHGAIGMHPSLLPTGRGRAPIPWTVLHRLRTTGLTVFRLEEGPDEGEIIDQLPFTTGMRPTASGLFRRFLRSHEVAGYRLGTRMVAGRVISTPQDDSIATYWPKRVPLDSVLDFTRAASDLELLVRAQTDPYPNAYCECRSGTLSVTSVSLARAPMTSSPGDVVAVTRKGYPVVACGEAALTFRDWKWSVHPAPDWIPGVPLLEH